jgi:hypothetical protein
MRGSRYITVAGLEEGYLENMVKFYHKFWDFVFEGLEIGEKVVHDDFAKVKMNFLKILIIIN